MYNKIEYPSKLRVIHVPNEAVESVTVLVLVEAGSRYETKEISGIAHFLEHMFFKGAAKYTNPKEVTEALDSVGASYNAFTGKEYVGYYVKIRKTHVERACDVLSDMLLASRFEPEEIDKERGVIYEEYNMYQDTPSAQVGWDFEQLVFGDQPLGWDQVGTKDTIYSLQREDFIKYMDALYTPDNTVIVFSGNVSEKEVMSLMNTYFQFPEGEKARACLPVELGKSNGRVHLTNKKTEQTHLILGGLSYDLHDERRTAAKVLASIMGGNMSSRMFQEVREQRGLAYHISSYAESFIDTGLIYTHAGVTVDKIDQAIEAILEQYDDVVKNGVTDEELMKAKEYMKGRLTLSLEDTEEVAMYYAEHELMEKHILPPSEYMKKIDAVTKDEIAHIAKELFARSRMYLAIIGPYEDKARFEKILG